MKLAGLIFLLVAACAPLSEEELERREYNEEIDRQNWELCQIAYRQANAMLAASSHAHSNHRKHRTHEIREDLIRNSCKRILGPYWADHI